MTRIPPDWRAAFAAHGLCLEVERLIARTAEARASGRSIAPCDDAIFRALDLTPPDSVKAVILGQDPYPTPGHADGLCFSVRPGVAVPRSLRNIFRELTEDLGFVAPSHGNLETWAQQGVLLLNTALTVEHGAAAAHRGWGWQGITDAIAAHVSDGAQPVAFMLWGSSAHAKAALVDQTRHLVLRAAHPSPLSARRGFFGCRHFSQANAFLGVNGRQPIDWSLPAAPSPPNAGACS